MSRLASAVMVLPMLLVPILPAMESASGGPPPFGIGDWLVTGNETLENGCLMLDGDLTVASGGILTLSNFSLTVHCDYSGEHAISVRPGGTLRILNGSMVNSLGEWWTFSFTIYQGAVVDFEDSMFATCGVRGTTAGGIIVFSDEATIRNCTFTAAHYALSLLCSRANLRDCTFSHNYCGLVSYLYYDTVYNCTFTENGFGAWGAHSYEGCTFSGNAIGAFEIFRLTNCSFTGNYGMGIFVGNWITGCEFVNNTAAIDCGDIEADYHGWLNLTNSNFSDNLHNVKYGRGYWNISRPCRVQNGTVDFAGCLTVKSGGTLTLSGSVLSMGTRNGGGNPIEVRPGGRLELRDGSAIRALNASFPYSFRCLHGSSFSMDGAILRDCGQNETPQNASGPLLETSDVRIVSSTIDYNPVALQFNGSAGALIESSYLRGYNTCLDLDRSSVKCLNSTLATAGDRSASLNNSSLLDCVDSTLNRTQLRFGDKDSRVNLSWHLDVLASWDDDSPIMGANVSVADKLGVQVASAKTDDGGRTGAMIVQEASIRLNGNFSFTPHFVNCSRGSIFNGTTVTMDRSRSLPVMLEDRSPPQIAITCPAPDEFFRTGELTVRGTASDNLGVENVELITDGFRRFTTYSSDGLERPAVGWNLTLALLEGPHTVEARAFDRAGHFASAIVSFTVDWSAPRIRIASPPDGFLTNRSLIAVSGFMEPGCRVLLGSSEVRTARDTFDGTVVLGEGPNLVTATAQDRAGNSNSTTVSVRLDTLPPSLLVLWPPDGLRTNVPMVAVNGTMEPGSTVSVNGRLVVLAGESGTFRTAVALPRESNLIAVDAVDPAGNHNLTVRTVTLDTRPPALEIESPAEGLLTNRSDVWLTGAAEGGAVLSVDGCLTRLPGEPGSLARFAVPLALSEGTNTVLISAADAAGNLNSTVRHIQLDTRPPVLAIDSPADGHRTSGATVFLVGETEPGVILTVNGREVPVGSTGSFSLESRLLPGFNRFAVRAEDSAGNTNETAFTVQRIQGPAVEIIRPDTGVDWPFVGFVVIAIGIAVAEGYLASRHLKKKAGV